jgi:hypothetical protein
MKWVLKSTSPILFFLSCNSSSTTNDDVKVSSKDESNNSTSSENPPNQNLTEFDKLYVGTWESENISRDDNVEVTDPAGKTYLRITKPDEYYRVELKSSKTNGYKLLNNKFQKMSDFLIQIEEAVDVQNILMLDKQDKLKFESRPMWNGTATKGTITIIYQKIE